MRHFKWKNLKKYVVSRALPLFLAALMVLPSAPLTGISAGEDAGKDITQNGQSNLVYDYDTLKITQDGEEISSLSIYPYEKIDVSGTGVPENATYQWQIKHPEKNNLWVDIYDAKSDNIGVSVALINNMLAEDGTAKLRLRAYTEDYAYLSNTLTVKILEEEQSSEPTLSVKTYDSPYAMAGETSDEHPEFVTVTIEYVKWEYHYDSATDTYVLTEMGAAFSSYMASLVYNGSLTTTVVNPTIVGFDPYLGDSDTSVDKIEINLTNITENVVYTVNYKPAKVKYEVNYYFQNIYDDLYAEDSNLALPYQGEGLTGMPPYYREDASGNIIKDTDTKEGVYAEFDGFTALYYQPDTIAADGSTVFEVYYERNYYLMEFDCAGGYGVHTLYVRHGTYVSVPTPTRPGYVFNGWDKLDAEGNGDGTADTIPAEMPIGNTAYVALWRVAQTTYTVVYWRENADDNGYSYWGFDEQPATSNSQVTGTVFTTAPNTLPETSYFTYNAEKTIAEENARTDLIGGKVIVEGDGSTIVNTYFSRNVYTAQFNIGNNTFTPPAASHVHTDGNCSCNYSHVHGPECERGELTCTTPVHTEHTAECIKCGKVEHIAHTDECCTKEPHTHTVGCYVAKQQLTINNNNPGNGTNLGNMREVSDYLYRLNNTYYLYIGSGTTRTSYFQISNANDNTQVELTCTSTHTTHNRNCFAAYNVLTIATTPSTVNYVTQVSGNLYRSTYGNTYYYVRVGDDYYRISNANNQTILSDCGKESHTHDDGNCTCGVEIHTHDDTCYKDEIHTHIDSCYEWSCGETEHIHSEACCTKPISYVEGTGTNKKYYIKAKYNQTIGDIWPSSSHYSGLYGWSIEGQTNTTAVSKKVNMTTDLCDTSDGVRVVTPNTSNTSYTVHLYYMFESFDQTSPADGNDRKRYPDNASGIYYDKSELYYQDVRSSSSEFSQKAITGMTAVDVDSVRITNNEYNNFLYYTRNSNTFTYFNYNEELTDNPNNNIQIKFEKPLSYLQISKEDMEELYYPSTLEPNAYEFGGWYTTPKCFPGTEVDWENLTMPDAPLIVYAKWTPVVRNVTFHLLYTDIEKGVYWYPSEVTDAEKPGYYPLKVPHGELLGTTYSHIPTREGDYQFIGWFYFDENGKKKFAPDSMKITRDMVLFAEWLSTIPTTYEVTYEAWDGKSETKIEDIADKLEGYSTAGKTTTFNAKGGNALYDKKPIGSSSTTYRENWFPEHSSHSILMDEDSSKNTHTFKYYYKEYINYKVIYIDRATGTILGESEVKRTSNAIVTEKFKPFEDYLPENYYIEKPIAYDSTNYNEPGMADHVQPENIIYFYYNEDKSHDPFRVEHWYQELDDSWTLKFSENGIADNGDEISRDARNDTGFVFDHYEITTYSKVGAEWKPNTITGNSLPAKGNVSVHGMEIKFYYTRKDVDYTIKYVEFGSNPEKVLQTSVGTKKFGEEVTIIADAVFVKDELTYIHVDGINSTDEQRSLTKVMRADAEDNVFVFYYNLKTFDIYYHVVCTTPGSEGLNQVSFSKHTVSVLNSSIRSTALVGEGFEFKGWYYDEACLNPVPDSWLVDDGRTIVPQGISDEAHYYAKFEPISGSLEIIKDVTNPDTDTAKQNFLFHIKGKNARNSFVDIVVSINGEGSLIIEDLPIGDYDITELTGWSWDYTADIASYTVTITANNQSTVTFTNTDNNSNWLNGEASNENVFN